MMSLKVVRALGVLSAASLVSLAACGGGAATDTSANNAGNSSSSGGQTPTASDTSTTAATATTPAAGLVANGDAHVGDRTNCPVSGEEFVVSATSPSVVHEGKTYYMCCPGCSARFSANPQQYITAMASRGTTAAPAH